MQSLVALAPTGFKYVKNKQSNKLSYISICRYIVRNYGTDCFFYSITDIHIRMIIKKIYRIMIRLRYNMHHVVRLISSVRNEFNTDRGTHMLRGVIL